MISVLRAKRSTSLLAILLAGLVAFTGCVSMEIESEFDEDGGAVHTMELTIDMSDLEQLGEMGEVDPFENFDEAEEEASEEGFRVERIEDGDIVGVRLIQEVDDSSDLGDQLNRLFNAGAAEGEDVAPFSGTFEKDGDDYALNLTVDGATLTDTAGEGLDDTGDLGIGLDTIFEFTYTARLPGEIDEDATNGRVIDDTVVTWDLPLEGSETLTAASSTDGGGSGLILTLVVVGIIVLGVIALAAVIFLVLMNRRGTEPATVTPEGQSTPPMTEDEPAPPPPGTYDPDQPTRPIPPQETDPPDDPERDDPTR